MIVVFDKNTPLGELAPIYGNGLGAIEPTKCEMTEELNKLPELVIEHPIDEFGKWRRLQRGNIVRVPGTGEPLPAIEEVGESRSLMTCTLSNPLNARIYRIRYDTYGRIRTVKRLTSGAEYNRVAAHFRNNSAFYGSFVFGGKEYWEIRVKTNDPLNGGMDDYRLPYAVLRSQFDVSDDDIAIPTFMRFPVGNGTMDDVCFRIYRVETRLDGVRAYARHIACDLLKMPLRNKTIAVNKAKKLKDLIEAMYTALGNQYGMSDFFLLNVPGNTNAVTSVTDWYFSDPVKISGSKNTIFENPNPIDVLYGKGGIAENFGIDIWFDGLRAFYLRRGRDSGVHIREGKTLTGLSVDVNDENVTTALYPYGRKEDDSKLFLSAWTDTEYATEGRNFVPATEDAYPAARAEFWEVSEAKIDPNADKPVTLDSACEMLENAALDKINEGVGEPEVSVNVEFQPIEYLEEYADLKALERVYIGDTVHVKAESVAQDIDVRVNSITWDCIAKRYTKMKMMSRMERGGLLGAIWKYIR